MSQNPSKVTDPIKRRSYIKGRLTIFKSYLDEIKSIERLTDQQAAELRLRLTKIEACFSTFDDLQSEIEIESEDPKEQMKVRSEIEGQFYSLISEGQCILDKFEELNVRRKSIANTTFRQSDSFEGGNIFKGSLKLPTIRLPTFDGNYNQWLEYKDTYEAVIHNNDAIETINKFHYLRSSLEGSAALVIKSLSFCADNYCLAWNLLCQRYNNKRLLISNHMKSIFSMECITKESDKALRVMIDSIKKNLSGLEALGKPVEHWDDMIIHFASLKLDNVTSRRWEEHKSVIGDDPTLEEFFKFLRDRADVLETIKHNKSSINCKNEKAASLIASAQTSNNNRFNCIICKQDHRLFECTRFISMNLEERNEVVSKNKLCVNCLKPGHRAFNCKSSIRCKTCNYKHNLLLHRNRSPSMENNTSSRSESSTVTLPPTSVGVVRQGEIEPALTRQPNAASAAVHECPAPASEPVSLSTIATQYVLLSTALINVVNETTNEHYVARALLDSGSQISIVTESFCNKLGLSCRRAKDNLNVYGIGNTKLQCVESCNFVIKSIHNDFSVEINCIVLPKITNMLPNVKINVNELKIPGDVFVNLADSRFYEPANVDILIGADLFWELITGQQIRLGKGLPILQSSKLGWLVTGPVNIFKSNTEVTCNLTRSISEQLEKFWKVEEILNIDHIPYSNEEEFCEKHFVKHTYRTENGRFCVKMPFHTSPSVLGDSFVKAKSRLNNLEKRLKRQPKVKESYVDFLNEYEHLNHLSETCKPEFGYYLPHHPVIREKSETTKLRVVFNASEKTDSGYSLNDIQMVGPVIQDDIISILLRFRQHNYVMTSDIEKMYRQILISDSQRHLQMILWRDNEHEPLRYLKLNTVTYGTASAPYLSTRCLLQLANECNDPEVREIIKHDFFMDDLITGHQTEEGLNRICRLITQTLDSGGFKLRKFRSNANQLLVENKLHETQAITEFKTTTSTLGLTWSPQSDKFQFSVHVDKTDRITKRSILSSIAKIFDPLGLLSIFVVKAKLILQKLWISKLEWDDPVADEVQIMWYKFIKNMNSLTCVEVPRHVMCKNAAHIEIHIFSDASMCAYGTCVFVRSIDPIGEIHVQLLCAKSRVAPLKSLTIPKLELCGALLSAELGEKVTHSLRCTVARCVYWTDSMVVLGWLRATAAPKQLKVFVSNRVNKINNLTKDSEWRYVPTDQNPADLISRGVDRMDKKVHRLWWSGPPFLSLSESQWPKVDSNKLNSVNLPEVKIIGTFVTSMNTTGLIEFERYSSLHKVQRAMAYVLRFVKNCRNKNKEGRITSSYLSADELNDSLMYLVKFSQHDSFSDEYVSLLNNKPLRNKCKILSLSPFLDSKFKVIRVGGRIQNSTCSYYKKHPLLLDSKHRLSRLIFESEHSRLLHAGPQLMLSAIREKYWIINARKVARSVSNNCIVCKRFRFKPIVPIMGNLPKQRLIPGTPFETSGVDLAGPFLITDRKGRGCKISKCYMCLFVCFTTKAIHLEVVSDLSTDAFLLALRRFIARRSKPSLLYCDNATNFLGASNELNKYLIVNKDKINKFCSDEGMKFAFIPPYAPNFGGLWEAGVKSAKYHIKRILGDRHLTYEELSTLFVQVEAILNSRPLFPMSSDPNDFHPLTPGHFLVGKSLIALPSPVLTNINCNRLHRYEQLERLRQLFWLRWQHEYITELQHRTKWRKPAMELRVGDMVIIKENNLPPLKWRLGRIEALQRGNDDVSRVADVRTASGTIRRAVNRLCPLFEPEAEELKESPSTGGVC